MGIKLDEVEQSVTEYMVEEEREVLRSKAHKMSRKGVMLVMCGLCAGTLVGSMYTSSSLSASITRLEEMIINKEQVEVIPQDSVGDSTKDTLNALLESLGYSVDEISGDLIVPDKSLEIISGVSQENLDSLESWKDIDVGVVYDICNKLKITVDDKTYITDRVVVDDDIILDMLCESTGETLRTYLMPESVRGIKGNVFERALQAIAYEMAGHILSINLPNGYDDLFKYRDTVYVDHTNRGYETSVMVYRIAKDKKGFIYAIDKSWDAVTMESQLKLNYIGEDGDF